ncbi:hypothetical protein [Streptomyces antimicrobicus]|uniref:Uncharacterized protein n=1 Tax=Streptomyces antimicrobicus TaxID=2883108 RepID=A0ABS8BA58_9ACTN|nr:hypothetical protein [Streptomyces antimicrobicus]MCB5181505.1 hypothetical protein [Streptomyces antimicrobicus]
MSTIDIVEIAGAGDIVQRDEGLYLSARHGRITWQEGGGTWQATGATVWLMDGRLPLATHEIESPNRMDSEEWWEKQRDQIAPWARALRPLARLTGPRQAADAMQRARGSLEDGRLSGFTSIEEELVDEIKAQALPEEIDAVRAETTTTESVLGLPPVEPDPIAFWSAVAHRVISRLNRTITDYQRVALTLAPDIEVHGAALRGWQCPRRTYGWGDGASLATAVAQELLAGWAAVHSQRDPLLTWSIQCANVSKARAHALTGLSRATIDRVLA